MSSSILQTKPESLKARETREKYQVDIVGCQKSGIVYAILFAEAGFVVTCLTKDQTIIDRLTKGRITSFLNQEAQIKLKKHLKTAQIRAASDAKTALSQNDIIVITTPTKIGNKHKPDYSAIETVCKQVGPFLRPGSLVIMASIVGVGFTENKVRELLENTSGLKVGVNLGLAYCGSWTSPKGRLETSANERLIVAATDKTSLQIASAVMETIFGRNVRNTENMKMAEAAVLFDIARWNVNVALSNEFALFCEKAGIDYTEVDRLASADLTEAPLTLVNPDAQTEVYFLFENAEDLNMTLRILEAAAETNEEITSHVINLTRDALRNCGKTLRGARVTVLGVSGTPNMKDLPKRAVEELVKILESKGARVGLYDPFISADELLETQSYFKRTLNEALEGIDCIIISTGHDQFKRLNLKKLKAIMKTPAAIIDPEGIMEPDKIEKEGFTYRRLGRGAVIK